MFLWQGYALLWQGYALLWKGRACFSCSFAIGNAQRRSECSNTGSEGVQNSMDQIGGQTTHGSDL